jgi:hypothetical protein
MTEQNPGSCAGVTGGVCRVVLLKGISAHRARLALASHDTKPRDYVAGVTPRG